MGIIIDGTTGIDLGHTPVNNGTNYEVEGNLNLSGVGARITGDFSNAIISNRVAFQTSTTNTATVVGIIPNGTGVAASYAAFSSSDADNSSYTSIGTTTGLSFINSSKVGTGSYVPLVFKTCDAERMIIDTNGNVGIAQPIPASKLHVQGNIRTACAGAEAVNTRGIIFDIDGSIYGRLATDNYGNLLFFGTGALGYGTGSGGTVTQATSKGTSVTLNKPTGQIIMNNSALAPNVKIPFLLYNSLIYSADTLLVSVVSGSTVLAQYEARVRCAGGVAEIILSHTYATSLSDSVVINFAIIKGAIV